jgi:hypothetical protein
MDHLLLRAVLSISLGAAAASCEMSPSKNPLISQAQTILVSTNIPAGKAWRSDSTLVSSSARMVPAPGIDLTNAVISALPSNLQVRTLPASVIQSQFERLSIIEKLNMRKIEPRSDCDLVLWMESAGQTKSHGYYNAAAGAYISGGSSMSGLMITEDRTLGSPGGGVALCSYHATLFDAKSGEPLSNQAIIISHTRTKGEHIQATLKRAVDKAANDTVIVLGLKAGKLSTVYLRDERQTRAQQKAQFKSELAAGNQKIEDAFAPLNRNLDSAQKKLIKIQSGLWKQSNAHFKKAFGVKDPPPAPAASPETTAP